MWTLPTYPLSRLKIKNIGSGFHIYTTCDKLSGEPVASWAAYNDPLFESSIWSVNVNAPTIQNIFIGLARQDSFLNVPLIEAKQTNILIYNFKKNTLTVRTNETESIYSVYQVAPQPVVVVLNKSSVVLVSNVEQYFIEPEPEPKVEFEPRTIFESESSIPANIG